jgi:hypothetical protein
MADLWADFNKTSREASMLRMEPQGYAPWVAARKAIEDSIRAEEAEKWREALGWALDTLYQMDGTRDSLRGYPPYVKARALLSRPEASGG